MDVDYVVMHDLYRILCERYPVQMAWGQFFKNGDGKHSIRLFLPCLQCSFLVTIMLHCNDIRMVIMRLRDTEAMKCTNECTTIFSFNMSSEYLEPICDVIESVRTARYSNNIF